MKALREFAPAPGLANPHVQTVLSSVARKVIQPRDQAAFDAGAERHIVQVDGVQLAVDLNPAPGKPLVIIIPGWLGSSRSTYVMSSASVLHRAGFATARINLRDHGETAHLNEGLFNSALIEEVVSLVRRLRSDYGQHGAGLLGYSLGGNFALRIARVVPDLPTLAVCPAIEPAATMVQIDRNPIYQRYFVRKWRKAWRQKQAAFPSRYDFTQAFSLNTVSALTDYFVRYHSAFESTDEYFAAYDLSEDALSGVNAHILAAHDDPIIPAAHYANLPGSLSLNLTARGGHGAYLSSWRLQSWADRYARNLFEQALT